jgi:hypothetical protein
MTRYAAIAAFMTITSCTAIPYRPVAVGAVRTLAHAVHDADVKCAAEIRATSDDVRALEIGQRCVQSYRQARAALTRAEASIDGDMADVSCALGDAVNGLTGLHAAISAFRATVPQSVTDAVEIARFVYSLKGCQK